MSETSMSPSPESQEEEIREEATPPHTEGRIETVTEAQEAGAVEGANGHAATEVATMVPAPTAAAPATEVADASIPAEHVNARPRRSGLWVTLYMLASMIGGLSSVCIKQLLLPLQVAQLDPKNTYISFLIVASLGALAGLIASPLSGALSDRTTSRWGRRRPWIIGGVLTLAVGLLIMAFATTIPVLLLGEIVAQFGADALLATETAIIPDQVPATQRAIVAAFNGMSPIVGGTLGLLLVSRLTNIHIIWQGYVLLAAVSLVLVGIFLLVFREQALPREAVPPFRFDEFWRGFWISPKHYPNFMYVVGSRCLVFLSFTMLGAYTLFYMRSVLRFSDVVASQNVGIFQLLSTSAVLVGAIIGGLLSKRVDRLKPFVVIGALLMAVGLFSIGFISSWSFMQISALIFGSGFGLYLGVDIALAVSVLPDAKSSGKDLGILHMAIFLPLVLSPILGSGLLTLFSNNFTLLFCIAACSSLLAAVLIWPVKAVR